jgi:predicted permease
MPVMRRVTNLFRRTRVEREIEDEVAAHLAMRAEDNLGRGMSADEAWRDARIRFGNPVVVRERTVAMDAALWMESVWADVRFAMRTLARDRAFSVVAALVLALGIGANIAVFSVVDTMLLRPLPFPDANGLMWLEPGKNLDPKLLAAAGLGGTTFDVDDYEVFQRNNKSFESVTGYNPFLGNSEYTLTGDGAAQGLAGVMVAGNFFQTLGVRPSLGRLFVEEEIQKGGRPAVLLSDGFWRRQFHADAGIVGHAILLNKKPVTVVGVMPASFDFGSVFAPGMSFDVFMPAVMDAMRNWGNTLSMVGRLKPGVTAAQAQAESDTVFAAIKAAHPGTPFDFSPTLVGLKDHVSGKLRRSMVMLWFAVGLVLLIVCVNLSSLLVARATARGKEFATRSALGAGRGRLFRMLMAESLVLVSTGVALGLGLAFSLTYYLVHQESIVLPLLREVQVDGRALAWTLMIALAVTVLFGMAPGLKLAMGGRNLQAALKDGGRGSSAGGKGERLRSAMVVVEVALSCVLLVGAGLLLRSFLKTLDVDMGFDVSRAAAMKIDYDQSGDGDKRGLALREILRRVTTIPGVQSAGVADMLPLGRNRSWQFWAKEHAPMHGAIDAALVRIVTPGYLAAMGMRLREGRDFDWQDGDKKDGVKRERVVILNQAAARHFWPGEEVLGKIGVVDGGDSGNARVIGVIQDVSETSLETAASPEIYLPAMQAEPEGAELVLRSALPASTLSESVLGALRSINPGQPGYELRPLGAIVDRAVSPRRFFMVLVMSFAGLGLVLASLGIYGVISYSVAQRTQEIGIRMALGATAWQVQIGVMGKTLRLAAMGVAVGTATSFAMARGIAALLFGTAPTDPITYAGMIVLLVGVGLLAGYIPARRAAMVNPVEALRAE